MEGLRGLLEELEGERRNVERFAKESERFKDVDEREDMGSRKFIGWWYGPFLSSLVSFSPHYALYFVSRD